MPRPAHKCDLKDIAEGRDALWRCPEVPLKMTFLPAGTEGVNHEDFRFEERFAAALAARLPGADPRDFLPYRLRGGTPEEREPLERLREQCGNGGCKIGGYPRYYSHRS